MAEAYHVLPHEGRWAVKHAGATRNTSVHDTQKEAIAVAREHLKHAGGGELNIHGENGEIREKDTVPPGHDPHNVKG